MKNLVWIVGAVVLGSAVSVMADDKVDFHAVNPVMESLADAVVIGDDTVDFAYPRFDEAYSDLDAEKIKYDLQGSIKNTPWLDGGKADVVVSTNYAASRATDHLGIVSTGSTTIRTDVLALIRYTGYIALRKIQSGGDPMFAERMQAHFKRLSVVTSLNEVYDLLMSGQQLGKDMIQYRIDESIARLKCLQDGSCVYTGNPDYPASKQIADEQAWLKREQDAMASMNLNQIQLTQNSAGVAALTIANASLAQVPVDMYADSNRTPGHFEFAKAVFTADSLSASANAFAPASNADLDKLKTDLNSRLVGLQNGNSNDKDITQKSFRDALILFKNLIQGRISTNFPVSYPSLPPNTAPIPTPSPSSMRNLK